MITTDSDLQGRVLSELTWEPSIDAAEIGVSADDHVVTLRGNVATYTQKLAAARAARRVFGVRQDAGLETLERLLCLVPLELLELLEHSPRNHAAPAREPVELVDLEADLPVLAQHSQLQPLGRVAVDVDAVVRVRHGDDVGPSLGVTTDPADESRSQDRVDLCFVELADHPDSLVAQTGAAHPRRRPRSRRLSRRLGGYPPDRSACGTPATTGMMPYVPSRRHAVSKPDAETKSGVRSPGGNTRSA